MKNIVKDFIHRGAVACGVGPIVLAVLYLILQNSGAVEVLTVNEVCIGIFSLSALAFIAGGMNVLYQIEQLPLMTSISIHGGVLYVSYLATYLINDWLDRGIIPILIFTCVFVLGYLLIWFFIYYATKKNTEKLNKVLMKNKQGADKKH